MANPRFQIPNSKSPIVLLFGAVLLLGAVAWGVGWAARALRDRQAAPSPTETTATPTVLIPLPSPTLTTASSSDIPAPTSTLMPTPTPLSVERWETVQQDEGLYMVCRRHCPGRWPPDDDDLIEYAQEVARLNGLSWPDPPLDRGQRLRMPPCP